MNFFSIKNIYSKRYLSDRTQVINMFRKKLRKASYKDLEEIYDYAYSFGEEYGRESEGTYMVVKIVINLISMTKLSIDDISNIVNPDCNEQISQYISNIKNNLDKNNK